MNENKTMQISDLKKISIFRDQAYINGKWIENREHKRRDIIDPATQEIIGSVPELSREEIDEAIAAAHSAFLIWRQHTAKERAQILRKWFDLIIAHQDDLATILTREQGKPLAEAKGEIIYAASFIEWFAEQAKRLNGEVIPSHKRDARIVVIRQPIGVIAAITPWNFPAAMITRKVGPALGVGCSALVKPAGNTPFTALALAELAHQAGVLPGVLNVVTGNAKIAGAAFLTSKTVRGISFTGSTEVGKYLMQESSKTVKRIALELGGHAPFIVFDDANIDRAVQGAMLSKFRNSGQTCVCANRFYVQEKVYDEFIEKFAQAIRNLKIGNGFLEGVEQGPLIDASAVEKVQKHVEDAKQNGAEVVTGGKAHSLGGLFYQPTLLAKVNHSMLCTQEETFGPVAPVISFQSEAKVIEQANDSIYGLAAYFYGRNMARVWRVAEALEYGIIGVNEGIISTEVAPFGGVKQSGIGREGSIHGTDEYVDIKYVLMGGLHDES